MRRGKEWRLPNLLYAEDLVLCGESEKDLKVMVGLFLEVCTKSGPKVNVDKRKVMVLGAGLEQVLEFKYLGCVLDESNTNAAAVS